MKKRLFRLFAATTLVIAAVACRKEQDVQDLPAVEEEAGVEITVVADGSIDPASKTAVVDGETPSVKWLGTDALTLYEIVDGAVNASTTTTSTELSEGGYVATFKATIPGADPKGASYKYAAVYPAGAASQGSGFYRLLMPAEQHLIGNNFSADSDLLISELFDNGGARVGANQSVGFRFKRVGTAIKLTLRGIHAGEKIKKVVITAPEYIAGRVKYDPVTGSLLSDSWHYGAEHQNTITLTLDELEATGTDVVWFRVLAAENWASGSNLSIEVETDVANYYRNGRDEDHPLILLNNEIKLVDGGLTAFGVNLSAYRVVKPAATRYVKVTSNSQIFDSGEYLLVGEKSNNAGLCALGSFNSSNYYNSTDVPAESDQNGTKYIGITSETVNVLTLETTGTNNKYYIKDSDGQYLYYTGSNNKVFRGSSSTEDAYKWTVSASAITNVGATSRYLKYNPSDPRFACYTSDSNITLYVKAGEPALSGTDVTISSPAGGVNATSTLSPLNLFGGITYECISKPEWAGTVSFDGNTMTVVSTENRTLEERAGIITVKASTKEVEVSTDILISQAASVFSAESTESLSFEWNDEEIKGTTITSSFELTDADNLTLSGDDADQFTATLTRVGQTDKYTLEVMPNGNNQSGSNYVAVVTVSRDGMSIPIIITQAYRVNVITINSGNITNTSYNTTEISITEGGATFCYLNAMRNAKGQPEGWAENQLIQVKSSSNGYLYNDSDLGTIQNIRVYLAYNTNSFWVYYGSVKKPNSDTDRITRGDAAGTEQVSYTTYSNKQTGSGTTTLYYYDFDLSSYNVGFFNIVASGTLYINRIVISYSSSGSITPPQATSVVVTAPASDVAQTTAVLNGSYSGATGKVDYTGFLWGTSADALTNDAMGSITDSPFTASITGLSEGTTYYYKAYVGEYNASTTSYEYRYGEVQSFTTLGTSAVAPGYLGCYEIPSVTGILNGEGATGTNSDRGDKWIRHNTTNSKRQIATHTFTHPTTGKKVRNYTVLYDESKYAPVWTAHAMHASMWPDKNVGRNDSWGDDPAISLKQQGGINNAGTVGYSRGHLVASNYRQSTVNQNKQTFYHSNQAPQWQNSFNSGVWSSLEEKVAGSLPTGRDTLYIVAGVLYEGTFTTLPSGSGKNTVNVPIPSHFYKCLMKCSFNASGEMTAAQGIAFIYTNEAHSGNYYASDYVTSIDAIEQRAGFDFFPGVPAPLQSTAEANTNHSWFSGK